MLRLSVQKRASGNCASVRSWSKGCKEAHHPHTSAAHKAVFIIWLLIRDTLRGSPNPAEETFVMISASAALTGSYDYSEVAISADRHRLILCD